MLHSLSNPEPAVPVSEQQNPWAVFDLFVFGIFFFLAMLTLMGPMAGVPIIYAIPLQGLFDALLVIFSAGWIRLMRRSSFKDFIRFFPNRTFSKKSLILLGAMSALAVMFISAFLPSSGPSPLEKLLTSPAAILMYAFFGVTLAPILEEIIFRGFLFRIFSEIGASRIATAITLVLFALPAWQLLGYGRTILVVVVVTSVLREILGSRLTLLATAALFALLHAGQLANVGYVILIFLVGCILSIVRYRSNSVISSWIVHASYNSMLFVVFAVYSLVQKIPK